MKGQYKWKIPGHYTKDTDTVVLYPVVYCAIVWKVYYTSFIVTDAVLRHSSHDLEQTWEITNCLLYTIFSRQQPYSHLGECFFKQYWFFFHPLLLLPFLLLLLLLHLLRLVFLFSFFFSKQPCIHWSYMLDCDHKKPVFFWVSLLQDVSFLASAISWRRL